MLTHLKDVMKKLMEAERVKIKLFDTLETMQEETLKFYHNYLLRNIDVRSLSIDSNFRKSFSFKHLSEEGSPDRSMVNF